MIFLTSILSRPPERRHPLFKWLITILASIFVLFGTILRTAGGEWQVINVERYCILSLASWIACIVMDGYLILNIIRAYRGNMRQLAHDFRINWTMYRAVEIVGLLTSLVSMANLGIQVYNNFSNRTSDVSFYIYFSVCVVCKLGRVLLQGQWHVTNLVR